MLHFHLFAQRFLLGQKIGGNRFDCCLQYMNFHLQNLALSTVASHQIRENQSVCAYLNQFMFTLPLLQN